MDSSVSPKDEIWFLRVCHHIWNAVYEDMTLPSRRLLISRVSPGSDRTLNTETGSCTKTWRYANAYSDCMFGSPMRWDTDVIKDYPLKVQSYGHITWHFCQCVSGYWHQQLGHEGCCWLTETGHVSMKTATGWLCRGTGRIQGTECLLTSYMMAVTDYWELKTAVN